MFGKMKGMYDMAKKAKGIQKKLRKTKITAQAEDEKIKVVMNAEMTIEDIEIDPKLLKKDKKGKLENGLKKALNEAQDEAQKVAAKESKELMGNMGM